MASQESQVFTSFLFPSVFVAWLKAAYIYELAEEQNFSIRTMKQAKKESGVKSFLEYDDSGNSSWYWRMNKDGEQEQKKFKFKKPELPKLPDAKNYI